MPSATDFSGTSRAPANRHWIRALSDRFQWHFPRGARAGAREYPGAGILLVFAAAMASVFLSLLLTFARTPWYDSYATTTAPWGLTPLADQQLAGVIMWIPAGAIYVAAALALLVAWVGTTERSAHTGGAQ